MVQESIIFSSIIIMDNGAVPWCDVAWRDVTYDVTFHFELYSDHIIIMQFEINCAAYHLMDQRSEDLT